MSVQHVFHDRRSAETIEVPLTDQQSALLTKLQPGLLPLQVGKKTLVIPSGQHANVFRTVRDITSPFGGHITTEAERRTSANLYNKVRMAIVEANPEPCRSCHGRKCEACVQTGRLLR